MRKTAALARLAIICAIFASSCVSWPEAAEKPVTGEIPLQEFPLTMKLSFTGYKPVSTDVMVSDYYYFRFSRCLDSMIRIRSDSNVIFVTGKMLRPGFLSVSVHHPDINKGWNVEVYAASRDTIFVEYDIRKMYKDRLGDYPLVTSTSALQRDLNSYMHIHDSLYGVYMDEKSALKQAMIKAIESGNKARTDAAAGTVNKHDDTYRFSALQTAKSFVAAHPPSLVTVYAMIDCNVPRNDPEFGFTVYKNLPDSIRESPYGDMLNERLLKYANMHAAVGKKLAALYGETIAGNALNTDSIIKSSKYTMVTFWATWCGSCIMKAPELKKLEDRFGEKGFSLVSVSIDKTRDIWLKGLKELDFPGIPAFEQEGARNIKQFNIFSVPYSFLADRNGTITNVNTPLDSIRMILQDQLLK